MPTAAEYSRVALSAQAEPTAPCGVAARDERSEAAGLVSIKQSRRPTESEGYLDPKPPTPDREALEAQGAVVLDVHPNRLKRMRRSLLTSARLMDQEARDGGFRPKVAMLTVTYRPDEDWQARQLTACLDSIRKWLRRRGHPLRYAWGLELTKAGRPHYHVLVWLPKGLTLPKPDKQGWWPHGFTRIEWARYALGYIAKYASKGLTIEEASQLPKGARLHGCAGLSDSSRLERRWWLAPKWVREQCDPEDDPRPAPGGGWLLRATGLHLPSPWRLAGHCPGWTWLAFQPAQGEL